MKMTYTWLIPGFTAPYKVSLKSHFQYTPKASPAIRRNTHSPREESERNLTGICGVQTIIKPTPLNHIFLNYSITVIYIPRFPQKRHASLENPPWQPSNPKSLYPYRYPSPHFDLIARVLRTSTLQFARGVHSVTYWICDSQLGIKGNI
ncbi:hypothetical protein N7501_003824 [Penicillium viridicatum]|nr:hypothetical protein N7501_003824 [Penicillium viridicatum]